MGTVSLASAPPRLSGSAALPLQLLPQPAGLHHEGKQGEKRLDVRQAPECSEVSCDSPVGLLETRGASLRTSACLGPLGVPVGLSSGPGASRVVAKVPKV